MSKTTRITLELVFLALVSGMALGWWQYQNSPEMLARKETQYRKLGVGPGPYASSAAALAEIKSWHEIGRMRPMPPEVDVDSWVAWRNAGVPAEQSNQIHLAIEGSFAASQPGVTFSVLDPQNWLRLQAGYPPLVYCSKAAGETVHCHPPAGEFYYGFFRAAPSLGEMPNSISGALIYALRANAAQNRPPARVSSDLEVEFEIFSTDQEAQKERTKLRLAASPVH